MVRRRSKIEKKKRKREKREEEERWCPRLGAYWFVSSLLMHYSYIYIDIARLRIGEFENTDIVITTFCVINDDDTIYSPVYVFRDVISRWFVWIWNDIPAELLWQQIIWNSYYQLFDNSINENFRKLVKNLTTMLIDIIIELTNSFIRKIFSSLSIEIQNLYDKFNDWFFFSLFLFFRKVKNPQRIITPWKPF